MNKVQTDNSYLIEKIKLRIDALPRKKNIKVLAAYGGDNLIWNNIQNIMPEKRIDVDLIEIKKKSGVYMKGDNLKYLPSLDLKKYDVIDLDAYGIPYEQMEIIFKKNYTGIVIVTYIQSVLGKLPNKFLEKIGYSRAMIRKCGSLFSKNGFDKVKKYLSKNKIKKIKYYKFDRKLYFYFTL